MHKDSFSAVSREPTPPVPAPQPAYQGTTYYGRPAVKASKYGGLVWGYTYVAGLAGGAQILATIADLLQRPQLRTVVRSGRYLAMLGPTVGAALLIADLHTPQRWYNMLRIFRKTSPMSIGTYILTSFSFTSGIAAAGQLLGRFRLLRWLQPAARVAQVPAALAGAGMGTYTGALLSSTSTPHWAVAPRLLTARFACSAMATAAAALSLSGHLWGERRNCAMLDRVALAATLADSVLGRTAKRQYAMHGTTPQGTGMVEAEHGLSNTLEHALPLLCYGLGGFLPKHERTLSVTAALGVLAGGLLMRSNIFHAGNRSARRPQDYFAFTQPGQQPDRLTGTA